jgi:lysozyme
MLGAMTTANVLDMFHGDNNEKVPDFARLLSEGIIACIHKATQGVSYADQRFADRAAAAAQVGMPFYAYHFNDGSDPVEQAKKFLDVISRAPSSIFGGCLDFENNTTNMTLEGAVAFLKYCDAEQNYNMPIYSGNRIRENLSQDSASLLLYGDFFKRRMLWLAEYGPHERLPAPWNDPKTVLWQFAEDGQIGGIAGHVDENYWPGTADELKAAWRSPPSATDDLVI